MTTSTEEREETLQWLLDYMKSTGLQPTVADASKWLNVCPQTARNYFRSLDESKRARLYRGGSNGTPMCIHLPSQQPLSKPKLSKRITGALTHGPRRCIDMAKTLGHPARAVRTCARRMALAGTIVKISPATYALPSHSEGLT